MEVACIRCQSKPCTCIATESQLPKSIFEVPMTMSLTSQSRMLSNTNRCPECSPKDLYVRFLGNLYLIYSAMEHELTNLKVAPSFPLEGVLFPEKLYRRSALSRDLTHFLGPGWKSKLTSTRATDNYIARIRQVGRTDSDLLLAHHSTRYIGDLQTCDKSRARTRRLFGLAASNPGIGDAELNSGVEFYVFEGIEDKKMFEAEYFEKIRSLDLSREVNRKIAKEAKLVYQLNMNLYWELRGMVSEVGKDFQLALDSKYQSLISIDGNVNKSVETPPLITTDELNSTENYEENNRRKIRCRGVPLFFYSLLFWLAVWLLFGAIVWQSEWVNLDDLVHLKKIKKTVEQYYQQYCHSDFFESLLYN